MDNFENVKKMKIFISISSLKFYNQIDSHDNQCLKIINSSNNK